MRTPRRTAQRPPKARPAVSDLEAANRRNHEARKADVLKRGPREPFDRDTGAAYRGNGSLTKPNIIKRVRRAA